MATFKTGVGSRPLYFASRSHVLERNGKPHKTEHTPHYYEDGEYIVGEYHVLSPDEINALENQMNILSKMKNALKYSDWFWKSCLTVAGVLAAAANIPIAVLLGSLGFGGRAITKSHVKHEIGFNDEHQLKLQLNMLRDQIRLAKEAPAKRKELTPRDPEFS